jgi:hypothetical protein
MNSRYDELERLQKLRESGALSDAEFQVEKRRILAHEPIAPGPRPIPIDDQALTPDRSRWPLYAILGTIGLAVAIAAGLLLGRNVSGAGAGQSLSEANVAIPDNVAVADQNLIAPPPPTDLRTLPPPEQLALATKAVFGGEGAATVSMDSGKEYHTDHFNEQVTYKPGRLLWPDFGPVLVAEGQVRDAAHVSAGKIGIFYLRADNGAFQVAARYPDAIVAGSFGKVARWRVSNLFTDLPVVYAEGGGTGQGLTCSVATLTEIGPQGPTPLATIPLSYSNAGAESDPASAVTLRGKVANVVKGQSFDVAYSGTQSFTEHYVRTPAGFTLESGKTQVPSC